MTRNFNSNTENEQEWLTPPEIVEALGPFDLDPCAPPEPRRPWPTATMHYSKEEHGDGLSRAWVGRVWLNPPYGRETFNWLAKLAEHKKGVALIFARTETKGFFREVWRKAHAVLFFEGRLAFRKKGDGGKADVANAPSCLVSYCEWDTSVISSALAAGKIRGFLVCLANPVRKEVKQ